MLRLIVCLLISRVMDKQAEAVRSIGHRRAVALGLGHQGGLVVLPSYYYFLFFLRIKINNLSLQTNDEFIISMKTRFLYFMY